MAMLFPAIHKARQQSSVVACASNLRQVFLGLQGYLNDNRAMCFWRGDNLNVDGMDWYVYGGRETANKSHDQDELFNRLVPRPLNKYLSNKIEVFHCPCDDAAPWTLDTTLTRWPAESEFDWVGNSYNFNANGYPLRPPPRHDGGLDGIRFSSIGDSSHTIVFYEACSYWGFDWHYAHKINIACADGHVAFTALPPREGELKWDP
jgi:hypothetical protein